MAGQPTRIPFGQKVTPYEDMSPGAQLRWVFMTRSQLHEALIRLSPEGLLALIEPMCEAARLGDATTSVLNHCKTALDDQTERTGRHNQQLAEDRADDARTLDDREDDEACAEALG